MIFVKAPTERDKKGFYIPDWKGGRWTQPSVAEWAFKISILLNDLSAQCQIYERTITWHSLKQLPRQNLNKGALDNKYESGQVHVIQSENESVIKHLIMSWHSQEEVTSECQ